ncbi:MAG: Fe-S cluster assembly ATPase SufC [Acidimicrobiia bacterium]|nr:Fe-S cluster assembly ATPase SufC [Acidimicrobiia bacterium]
MNPALSISDLRASVGSIDILKGVDLQVPFGEVHALMGPNGSGKSTLCHVLTGKSDYTADGSILLDGEELMGTPIDERAQKGLMQAFQYPVQVPGVGLEEFMVEVGASRGIPADELSRRIEAAASTFSMDGFLERSLNDELSGGEKKRSEMFQISVLDPKVIVLDEIDSGLDIDAVRQVSEAVEALRGPEVGILLITHYSRILRYLHTDKVHVMMNGRIVDSGGAELADELEDGGYEAVRARLGIEAPKPAAAAVKADPFADLPFEN